MNATILALTCLAPLLPAAPPARPVPFTDVTITDSFWSPRQQANATATLEANWSQCEKTGRLANFAKAAAKLQGKDPGGKYEGYFFNDSDVYKMLEGACDVLANMPPGPARDQLNTRIDALVALIGSAQHESGYLNGYFTLNEPEGIFTNLRDKHELYCAGHLIEAGVAHKRATGQDTLLLIARRLADHIEATFGPAPKRQGVPGHEEIELALVKLANATGEDRYHTLAAYFVEQRGRAEQIGSRNTQRKPWGEYWQDYAPVRDHSQAFGHAVRATYYYNAVTDLALATGDAGYTAALGRVWDDLTGTKMYVTGGIGTSAANEGFTTSYDLPNETAYAETCAGIGLVMWGHRMSLLRGEDGAACMDVAERALYNAVLSGVSLDGTRFFYDNPLASRGNHRRSEWFACACCPPNILRLVAQVGGMAFSQTDDRVFINLYMGSSADITLRSSDGQPLPITLTQETTYPWNGAVRIAVTTPHPAAFTLSPRIPGWCDSARASVNGEAIDLGTKPAGYATIHREWKHGDTLDLTFDMPPKRVYAHPQVKADVGRVTLQRGPLIYCFEGADQPGLHLRRAALPPEAPVEIGTNDTGLPGAVVLACRGVVTTETSDSEPPVPVTLKAIPYFMWANRDPGDMLVWIPESLALAEVPPDPTIKATASHCFRTDTPDALCDRREPANSADHTIPRLTFWPQRGTQEWVRYDFATPRTIHSASVYWFDDQPIGGQCRTPESWRVLALIGADWKEIASGGGVERDRFNTVQFAPVECASIKLELKLQGEGDAAMSAGILEWKVE